MKKFKNLKLVVLLVLFIVLMVGLSYNRDFSLRIFALIILVIPLGKSIFNLTDLVVEVKPLFSSISFVLCAIVGVYLIIYGENAFLPLAGGMICFLMIVLMIRSIFVWRDRRAIKKTE